MIGGLIGLAIVVPAAKKGFLLPKEPWDFKKTDVHEQVTNVQKSDMPLLLAWMPYILVALILVLTRLQNLPLKTWLRSVKLQFNNILGTNISTSIEPLYLPGTIFLVVIFITVFMHKMKREDVVETIKQSAYTLIGSAIALGTAVPMLRIFINSGINDAGLASMPIELASMVAGAVGAAWPLVAPLIGALGSFISGSATFSNMMFSLFQFSIADQIQVPHHIVIAGQVLGANAGNMVCVLNVVAAASVVGLAGKEGTIIRMTLIPMLYYVLITGMLSLLLIYVF